MVFKIFANLKMQVSALEARSLVDEVCAFMPKMTRDIQVVFFPEHLYVQEIAQKVAEVPGVSWGMQDVSEYDRGPHTGQVCAHTGAALGAMYTLVGHMECRKELGVNDEVAVRKALQSRKAGLHPVVCLGSESTSVDAQVDVLLAMLADTCVQWPQLTLAFEPDSAIGSGQSFDAQAVAELAKKVRDNPTIPEVTFAYGGSVSANNVCDFLRAGVQAVLVGSAAQKSDTLLPILRAVDGFLSS